MLDNKQDIGASVLSLFGPGVRASIVSAARRGQHIPTTGALGFLDGLNDDQKFHFFRAFSVVGLLAIFKNKTADDWDAVYAALGVPQERAVALMALHGVNFGDGDDSFTSAVLSGGDEFLQYLGVVDEDESAQELLGYEEDAALEAIHFSESLDDVNLIKQSAIQSVRQLLADAAASPINLVAAAAIARGSRARSAVGGFFGNLFKKIPIPGARYIGNAIDSVIGGRSEEPQINQAPANYPDPPQRVVNQRRDPRQFAAPGPNSVTPRRGNVPSGAPASSSGRTKTSNPDVDMQTLTVPVFDSNL